MGSLMAGWDSHVEDPKLVKLKRNSSSLTKEEIEAFWRSRKLKEEEHLRDISALSPRTQKNVFEDAERRFQKSISLPGSSTNKDEEMEALDMENNRAAFIQKNGWWISSNWAFLNEPPVIAGEGLPMYKYASQFHVANNNNNNNNMASKTNAHTGVGA